MRVKLPLILLLTASAALLAGAAAPALAATAHTGRPSTLYVGAAGSGPGGCAAPAYTSVQAAVDAAPSGSTVYLCGKVLFAEQVFVNKTITLTGAPGAGLTAPAASSFAANSSPRLPAAFQADSLTAPQALLVVTAGSPTVEGLTISGPLPGNGGCGSEEYGILVLGGGRTSIQNDRVVNIHDANATLYGCQFGVGIEVGDGTWPASSGSWPTVNFAGKAQIEDTTVSGYQKNGITADGKGSSVAADSDTVVGSGRDTQFAPIIAQNGIQISDGATGNIYRSSISGNSYTGTGDASASGILLFGGCGNPLVKGVIVQDNTLTNNDVGIAMANYNAACSSNGTQPTGDDAIGNIIRDSAVSNISGYYSFAGETYTGNGYQAGVEDIGYGDSVIANQVSGAGYAPAGTLTDPAPAFVRPVDTVSFPTKDPIVFGNSYHL
jgi:hypothetical protein